MNDHNIPSDGLGNRSDSKLTPVDSSRQLVTVTDTREMPDYSQQHIEDLHKIIAELKLAAEKDHSKQERIIGRLRFRLSLMSLFWFLTVLTLCGTFGWFGFRWYNQLQLQKQLATFSPEKVEEVEKVRNDIQKLNETVIPQLQTEIKSNQEELAKVNTRINKNQKSMSVLVNTIQELLNPSTTDGAAKNSTLRNQSLSPQISSPTPEPDN